MTMLKIVKPQTEAEKTTRTVQDTIEITPNLVRSWKLPPFQRPLRVNAKLMEIAKEIAADDGVVPGVLTLGVLRGESDRFLIDGQHRREAFLLSECPVGYVDVRIAHYDSLDEMADEFAKLNSRIVNMRPDDVLRALESSYPRLAKIRRRAPFVGYDQVRRSDKAPILSMSQLLRSWASSKKDTPQSGGTSATDLAKQLDDAEVDHMTSFLDAAMKAWGRDPEYARLWSSLNLVIVMWLYRRLVVDGWSTRTKKISIDHFTTCMTALSADGAYLDWLTGRRLGDVDRAPCYRRVKDIFSRRLETITGAKALLPSPPWAPNGSALKGSK
jgi:hypothetical protein